MLGCWADVSHYRHAQQAAYCCGDSCDGTCADLRATAPSDLFAPGSTSIHHYITLHYIINAYTHLQRVPLAWHLHFAEKLQHPEVCLGGNITWWAKLGLRIAGCGCSAAPLVHQAWMGCSLTACSSTVDNAQGQPHAHMHVVVIL